MDRNLFRQTLNNKVNLKLSLKSAPDIDLTVNQLTKCIQESTWSYSTPNSSPQFTKKSPIQLLIPSYRKKMSSNYLAKNKISVSQKSL